MADVNAIAEEIHGLTLMEAADLVKNLEEKLGVSAAAAAVAAARRRRSAASSLGGIEHRPAEGGMA